MNAMVKTPHDKTVADMIGGGASLAATAAVIGYSTFTVRKIAKRLGVGRYARPDVDKFRAVDGLRVQMISRPLVPNWREIDAEPIDINSRDALFSPQS